MKTLFTTTLAATLFLAGCSDTVTSTSTSETVDPITAAITGKPLVSGSARFVSNADGTTTGNVGDEQFVGTWSVQNGKLCNQFSKPKRFSKPACLDTTLNGDGTITIATRSGSAVTWTIED